MSHVDKHNSYQHTNWHTGEKSIKCAGEQYTQALVLQKHIITHSGEKPIKCDGQYTQALVLKKHTDTYRREATQVCCVNETVQFNM